MPFDPKSPNVIEGIDDETNDTKVSHLLINLLISL
jgi:hypothetical protein